METTAMVELCARLRESGASWAELGAMLGMDRGTARRKATGERSPTQAEEALARALLRACEPRAPRDLRRLLEAAARARAEPRA